MIRATTRPRRSSGARSAAKGIMTCPATEAPPTRTEARAKNHRAGPAAQATSATADKQEEECGQGRRGCRSPSGTISSSPAA